MSTLRVGLLQGGILLVAGEACTYASSFLRNVILARALSREDFGTAVVLSLAMSVLEMMTNLSTDKLLVQAERGTDPGFQGTTQAVEVARGIVISGLLFVLAYPSAMLFGLPQATWAFQALALVPLVSGFRHLDMVRAQRRLRYAPAVAVECTANLIITGAAWPLCILIRDYSVIIYLLLAKAVLTTVGSHLVAERRYVLQANRDYLKTVWAFGWPLAINGILLFLCTQGENFIIASGERVFDRSPYTLADLAVFSVAASLAGAATNIVANVSMRMFLPVLARVQTCSKEFLWQCGLCGRLMAIAGFIVACTLVWWGEDVVRLIYGDKYAGAGTLVGLLAAAQAVRIIRIGPVISAMAKADTHNAMIGNLARTAGLVGAVWAASRGEDLAWFAVSGLCGELFALWVCTARLQRIHGIPVSLTLKPAGVATIGLLVAGLIAVVEGDGRGALVQWLSGGCVVAVIVATVMFLCSGLRHTYSKVAATRE